MTLKKRMGPQGRLENAKRWLRNAKVTRPLTDSYMKRYGVERWVAQEELMLLGEKDTVRIEDCERLGIEWEFRVDGYTGEMKVVPEGTADHELHLF